MPRYKFLLVTCIMPLILISCLKDNQFLDVSNTSPIIEFAYGTDGTTSLGNFGIDATATELDTAFALNIASPQVLDYPVTVTLKIDASVITKFNSVPGATQLSVLPDSTFKMTTTSVTIPAGYRIARIPIILYPNKISPSSSYGLPISIVNATGPAGQNLIVSGNSGVALYAFIGNLIAGNYTHEWIRYNNATGTGTPAFDQTSPSIFKAVNPSTVTVSSGTGVTYIISFDNNGGVLSNYKASFDPASVTTAGITITGGPTVVMADAVVGKFQFNFTYNNSAGAARNITDIFTR